MIGIPKCIEFNKYMNYYKKKTHLSFYDYHNFLYATSLQFLYPSQPKVNISHLYDDWQKEHEVVHMDVEERKYVCIDFSLNSIADLIKIVNQNPIQENVDYNINLKMIHAIHKELCELDAMVGMQTLKKNVLEQLLYYLQGFHTGTDDYKHTVITGPPGTGKTEVAKILGTIYSKMGVISKPQDSTGTTIPFKKATRSDMIAGYLGQTAIKTKALISQCLGGVLFIDEAYSLGDDNFSKECVDTLCEALSDQKDNIMVIVAGYEKELNEQFFSLNTGLDSRFVWRFKIDNYVAKDLWEIFKKKVDDCKWKIENVDGEKLFKKWYDSFSGFGRDIESFLFKVKIAHSKRVYGKTECNKKVIELVDLNNGYEIFIKNKENTREYSSKKSQKILSSMFV
jgi:hypothetical protein